MANDDELNRSVLGLAGRRPSSMLEEDADSTAPLGRLTSMELQNSEYAEEYRLQLINRLLIRNVPLDQIAQQLQMTIPEVMSDRKKIQEMLKRSSKTLCTDFIIGDTMAFYNEVIGIAMRAASVAKSPMPIRLLALKTAMAGRRELNSFFVKARVIDAAPYTPENSGNVDDMHRIMSALDQILEDDELGQIQVSSSAEESIDMLTHRRRVVTK